MSKSIIHIHTNESEENFSNKTNLKENIGKLFFGSAYTQKITNFRNRMMETNSQSNHEVSNRNARPQSLIDIRKSR